MAAHDNSPHLKQVLHDYKSQAMNSLQGPGASEILLDSTGKHAVYPFYGFKKALMYGNVVRRPDEYKKPSNDMAKMVCLETKPPDKECYSSQPLKKEDKSTIKKETPRVDWVEPYNVVAPAPFPPKPCPVLASADPGQFPASVRSDSILDGEPIACFDIGGEPRLCLPQILNTVLQKISLTQINAVTDELQIYCSRCTPIQLEYLKDTCVLPSSATSCGLITRTDAHRLTHALLYRSGIRSFMIPKEHLRIFVSHTCFGKCKGAVIPDLYKRPEDLCVECLECQGYFTPAQFVCHAHRALETRTCHWGFDANNWRKYLTLSRDQGALTQGQAEIHFKAFKAKFESTTRLLKRKQQVFEIVDEAKKPRVLAYDNTKFEAVYPRYVFNSQPPLTVIPIVTKDHTADMPPKTTQDGYPIYLKPGCHVMVDATEPYYGDPEVKTVYPIPNMSPLKIRHKLGRNATDIYKPPKLDGTVVVKLEPKDEPTDIKTETLEIVNHDFIKREMSSDLELSTTDSDTESVSSNTSKCEVVEEAEALLRGFSDRAAAKKVLSLVESIARESRKKDRKIEEISKEKQELLEKLTRIQQAKECAETELPKKEVSDPPHETVGEVQ